MLQRLMLVLVVVPAMLMFGGCSASGLKYTQMVDQIPALSPSQGRIFFYRDGNVLGAAIRPSIRLNGEVVGKSERNGFFFVDRAPGSFEVTCKTEAENKLTFTLSAGERRYVRTKVSFGVIVGHVSPVLVEELAAMMALEKAIYTGPPMGAP